MGIAPAECQIGRSPIPPFHAFLYYNNRMCVPVALSRTCIPVRQLSMTFVSRLRGAKVFDPYSGRWTDLAPMRARRTGVAVTSGPCGRLYAVGVYTRGFQAEALRGGV